jgi:transcription factor E2F3
VFVVANSPLTPATKPKGDGTGEEEEEEKAPSRYDSSLGLLTKKFLQLINEADKGVIDLNEASSILGVQVTLQRSQSTLI